MTDFGSPPTALDEAAERLSAAAQGCGFTVEAATPMTGAVFKGGQGLEVGALSPSDLPAEARAVVFDRYSFVLTMLPQTYSEKAVDDSVRRLRNQCLVARTYLSPDQALDLQGILVAPRGSDVSEDWMAIALMIERDERVARKFVWLRSADEAEDELTFQAIVARSVLARPWTKLGQFTMAPLDNISSLASEADAPVSGDLLGDWIRLAATLGGNPDRLIDGLIESARKRGIL